MRTIRNSLLAVLTCAAVGIFSTSSAEAQAYKVTGSKPSFDDLQSPEFSGGKQKSFKPRNWLEVETGFTVQMSPEPPSKTAERVLVKWYLAVAHPDKKGAFLLLTKDVTHVNVPLNTEVYSSIYLSPSSISRLTGSDRGGKKAVELVGYEVIINGVKVAEETNKNKAGWWNQPSNSISRSDTVPLLDKTETPFAAMWWDRYAEVLVERR
jgi:hypothetical protein